MQLGKKGHMYKDVPWEETARVPLFVRAPALISGHGTVSPHVVSLIDLLPTLADLAGLPLDATFDGVSLQPLLEQPKCEACARGRGVSVLRVSVKTVRDGDALGSSRAANHSVAWSVRTRRWRYIGYTASGLEELYDHDADPDELVNLATAPGAAAEAKRELRAVLCEEVPDAARCVVV